MLQESCWGDFFIYLFSLTNMHIICNVHICTTFSHVTLFVTQKQLFLQFAVEKKLNEEFFLETILKFI